MNHVIRGLILVCLCAAVCDRIRAQADQPWTEIAPQDELFRISMPNKPIEKKQTSHYGPIEASGTLFDSTVENARYAVWVLNDPHYSSTQGVDEYLDASA